MNFYTCTIVVQVDNKHWSEQNDMDLDCMRQAIEDLSNTDGADEVPWHAIRPSTEDEITSWQSHQKMLARKKELYG